MTEVTVNVYTTLKEALGTGRIEASGSCVAEVLEDLDRRFGEKLRKELLDGNRVKDYFILLLNGHVIDKRKLKSTAVKDGDVIHIFPPIAGG